MEENEIIEGINEEVLDQVNDVCSCSDGSTIVKLAVGTLLVAAGVGAYVFYKKRKKSKMFVIPKSLSSNDCEEHDTDVEEIINEEN